MKKYDGVLKRVRILEAKKGISYATTDSGIYTALKWLCIIAAAWALLFNLLYVLSVCLNYSGTVHMKEVTDEIITVSICSAAIIASIVLNLFKLHIAGLVLNILPAIFLTLLYANLMRDDLGFLGLPTSFYTRHFAPLALMCIFFIWMFVIVIRARIKTNSMYKKVTENLYEMYRKDAKDAKDLTDEQWDKLLKAYDPDKSSKIVIDDEDTEETEEIEEDEE